MMNLPANVDVKQLDELQGEAKSDYVGNAIYEVILGQFGEELAPNITGMLLDESVVDFKQLLTNGQYFNSKVAEAHALLMQSKQAQAQQ